MQMKNFGINRLFLILFISQFPSLAWAMPQEGCGAGDCRDCHTLSRQEAATLLKGKVTEIIGVKESRVPGLWDIEAIHNGRKIPLYIDFSKQYLFNGNIIRLTNGKSLTHQRLMNMNKVDTSRIPLNDAVVIGNPAASHKIIVFDDPECSYCIKLHPEMEQVVSQRADIAFFVKMYPLAMHPKAYDKARAIICAKIQGSNNQARTLLSDSLNGKLVPAPTCESDQVDKNIALANELYISSTPTLIMPDGQVLPGYKVAAKIITTLELANHESRKP